MLSIARFWCTILGITLCLGCQSMGSNTSYLLKYKKHLRGYYKEIIENADKKTCNEAQSREGETPEEKEKIAWETAERKESRENEAEINLRSIYLTNLPLSLSDHYDTRNPCEAQAEKAINQGDPINLIINKVHLASNGERLCWSFMCPDTAEIAVVVSVDDGKEEEPKNVIVAYEEKVKENIDLPIGNLLAYANSAYDNQPIRVTLTVFEFDQLENENFKKMLGTAAGIGAAFTPAYAPAWSIATQVGNFLINQNKNDVLVKFTFQLYPRSLSPTKSNVRDLGMPPIQGGNYIILNTKDTLLMEDVKERIHLDFGLTAFKIEIPQPPPITKIVKDHGLERWPVLGQPLSRPSPLNESYAVLTVGKSPTRSAATIIDRLNTLNRKATGLEKLELRSEAAAALFGRELDDLRSAVTWYFVESEYATKKTDPKALGAILRIADDPRLTDTEKRKAGELIDRSLPPMSKAFKDAHGISNDQEKDLATRKAWYEAVKEKLGYDASDDRLVCKDDKGKEVDCQ